MCIIVAKNAGIKMPSMDILRNCFENNPDGAGFMLADGKAVYGFKGLMTFEEFSQELKKARKRFGDLDKLAVVLHFRISTHGSSVGSNTHPFPLKGGYRELRKSEWIADQGFAHNGIIQQTSFDEDVKKHNVSDTMVFAKKFVNPIAKYATIASDRAILDMLYELADSKLCFLSRKGKIATRGKFFEEDGVLYSNTSYEDRYYFRSSRKWLTSSFLVDYDDNYEKVDFKLSNSELSAYIADLSEEYGYYPLPEGTVIFFEDKTVITTSYTGEFYLDDCGWLYTFKEERLDFSLYAAAEEYSDIVYPEEMVLFTEAMS